MNDLVQLTLDAHGGLERWRRCEYVSAHLRNEGVLWALKRQRDVIENVNVRVALRREWASHSAFVEQNWRTSFAPHRVAIETTDGRVVEERLSPRDSFAGHGVDTPWDRLQRDNRSQRNRIHLARSAIERPKLYRTEESADDKSGSRQRGAGGVKAVRTLERTTEDI